MSIVITTTISIGVIIFAFITPLIVTQYEPDKLKENFFAARLVLGIAMTVVGTLQLVTTILSRDISVTNRLPWLCPRHSKDLETPHSVVKPLGIALFCVIGVYGTDVLFAIMQIASTSSLVPGVDIFFHMGRIYFSTMSAMFCFYFRKQRFVGNVLTLATLSLASVTALSLWFDLAIEERRPTHPNATSLSSNGSRRCRDSLIQDYLDLNSYDRQFSLGNEFPVMVKARPYLNPLIAELMILFSESYIAWFFGCILTDSAQSENLINESESSGFYSSSTSNRMNNHKKMNNVASSMSDDGSIGNMQSPLLGSNPLFGSDIEQSHEHLIEKSWSMYQYAMTLTTGLLSALFIIFGIFFYYKPTDVSPDFSILFAAYRVLFWSIFTMLIIAAYVAVKSTRLIEWKDSQVTSFEYFIIVCHVGTTLYSTFGITATLISNQEITNFELHLIEKFFNMAQYCSQVVFYFWARGVKKPSEELLESNQRVSVSFLLFQGVIISLAVLNLTMWIEDSFVELADTEAESLETEFFSRWEAIYNVLNPINLLFRFNSAVLFYELHHKLCMISLSALPAAPSASHTPLTNSLSASFADAALNEAEFSPITGSSQASGSSKWHQGMQRRSIAERRASSVGLRAIDVTGDGACMFRAVCVSNSGSDQDHLELRAAAVDYMRDNPSEFYEFGDQNSDEDLPFNEYLVKIAQPNQEVGEFALRAIANVLNKQINVYYGDLPPRSYIPRGKNDVEARTVCQCSVHTPCQCISVLYYDITLANCGHYMALVRSSIA